MATSAERSGDSVLTLSNWSSVDIADDDHEMGLPVSASPPLASIEEEEEEEEDDLLDYDDDDDDDVSPEMAGRPIYSSASGGVEDMNMLGLSELSDVGENEEFDVTEDEEEEEDDTTTKCCGKGTMRKIKCAFVRFAKATVAIIYKVYTMMTPKQKMVIAGAATAAVMSLVGIEREETTTTAAAAEGAADEAVGPSDGEDEMTTTDVMKDVASDFIHVVLDTIDKAE